MWNPIKSCSGRPKPFPTNSPFTTDCFPGPTVAIFAINELPDLQGKIQVGLFNIMQEGDVQIKVIRCDWRWMCCSGSPPTRRITRRAEKSSHRLKDPNRLGDSHSLSGNGKRKGCRSTAQEILDEPDAKRPN